MSDGDIDRRQHIEFDKKCHLEFQVTDWFVPKKCNKELNDYEDNYDINMYGVTEDKKTVLCVVKNYEPFFYVRCPTYMNKKEVEQQIKTLKHNLENGEFTYYAFDKKIQGLYKSQQQFLTDIKVVRRHDFWGYSHKKRLFLKVIVKTHNMFYTMQNVFAQVEENRKMNMSEEHMNNADDGWILYETNIEPFLRFIHKMNIRPCGWVSVNMKYAKDIQAQCNYVFQVDYNYIQAIDKSKIAPMLIASFDIECTSSHGDFPMAIKNYTRLAKDLCENCNCVLENNIDMKMLFEHICKDDYKLPNGNIVNKLFMKKLPNSKHYDDLTNASERIISYLKRLRDEKLKQRDVEMIEDMIKNIFTNIMPNLKGDPIIQIGTTFHYYGEDKICYKHLVSLKETDDIEGVDVKSCRSEKQLLREWKSMMMRLNPDVITGYNILGFDFKYIYDRTRELDMFEKYGNKEKDTFAESFGKYGENLMSAEFKKSERYSSAMGEVVTYMYKMDGVIIIDMLNYVKLPGVLTLDSYKLDNVAEHILKEKKVDLKPNEIFKKFKGTSKDRSDIGSYCIQDCVLVNRLIQKMKVIENNSGMANVCRVPLSYIFHRGQGIKIFSLVLYECSKRGQVMPTRKYVDDTGYEGAIVLEPKTGIYIEDPIVVFDYSSLYPSSMIAENLSHDSYIYPHELDVYLSKCGSGMYVNPDTGEVDHTKIIKKVEIDENTCHYFVNFKDGTKSTIPQILEMLITQRKKTRAKMGYKTVTTKSGEVFKGIYKGDIVKDLDTNDETYVEFSDVLSVEDTFNSFEKAVFDSLQLAYKITANSLYGQTGAKTSPVYLKAVAESTTATGRGMIRRADRIVRREYNADVIYGDTDSIFCKFPLKNKGKEAVAEAIEMGKIAEEFIANEMKDCKPQALNYEKVLYPFILFSKKRYVGLLYEDNPDKCVEKSMGIVLKRRDNAKILKDVYGDVIKKILWDRDLEGSFKVLDDWLKKLVDGDIDLSKLVISKTLKSTYKDPEKIAHKVLADRIAARDPGNKPAINDRLPYIYIKTDNPKALQGERIETPEYVREHPEIKPDYLFYIKNQIMKPCLQLYSLCVDKLPNYTYHVNHWKSMDCSLKLKEMYQDDDKRSNRLIALKENTVKELLFDKYISKFERVKTSTKDSVVIQEVEELDIREKIDVDMVVKQNKRKNEFVVILNGEKKVYHPCTEKEIKEMTKDSIIINSISKFLDDRPNTEVNFNLKGCADFVKDFSNVQLVAHDGNTISYCCKVRRLSNSVRVRDLLKYMRRISIVMKK